MKYFYDEHTCPTNWVRNIERFTEKGDTDPHGVFQYIDHVTDEELKSVLGADYKTTDSDWIRIRNRWPWNVSSRRY